MKNLRTVFFTLRGADFLCLPWRLSDGKTRYKLCLVKKMEDNWHNLSIEYEVICYVNAIADAKVCAKTFLDYFST